MSELLTVFLASSSDLLDERAKLNGYLSSLSNELSAYGVTISTFLWEDGPKNFHDTRKQDELNQRLKESDVAIFLFGTRPGKATKEEFREALNGMRHHRLKHVFAYFKNQAVLSGSVDSDAIENLQEILSLKQHISDELEQYYDNFDNVHELQSKIAREFIKIALASVQASPLSGPEQELPANICKLMQMYRKLGAGHLQHDKDIIIDNAYNYLHLLYYHGYRPSISEDEFYSVCESLIKAAQKGDSIKAISVMLQCEWDNSPEEISFFESNLNAAKRGVRFERIFLVDKNEAHRILRSPQIMQHINRGTTNLRSFILEKESLVEVGSELPSIVGDGYLLFLHTAMLDSDPQSGTRGFLVTEPEKIQELSVAFDQIKNNTKTMDLKEYVDTAKLSHPKKEMLSIFLTTKCNLNCVYCFTNKNAGNHKSQTIEFDFVKQGIDDYFKTKYARHIRFFGAGEPTCEFELMKKIHDYAISKPNSQVTFEIQTNGVFSEKIALWLRENIDIVWISCDGTPDIQDAYRPTLNGHGSSELIDRNIGFLKAGKKSMVGIRATITNDNISKQRELVDYFYGLGIRDIWVDPIFPSVGEKESKSQFDMMEFAKQFLTARQYAEAKGVFYGSILTCNFNEDVKIHCRACIPLPHLTTDGYVSACDMALFGDDDNHMRELIYGRWDKDRQKIEYDSEKIAIIQSRTTDNLTKCRSCESRKHCGGYCLGEVLNETGTIFGCKQSVCAAIRYLDQNMNESQRLYKYMHP